MRNKLLILPLGMSLLAYGVQATASDALVNVETTELGIHSLSYQNLKDFGVDLAGVSASQLSLENGGTEIQIQVTGGDTFGPGSSIRFIAKELDTLYTDTNVYTLALGGNTVRVGEEATPMSAQQAFANSYLETAKFAPQQKYSFTSPDQSDPWYAQRVVAVGEAKTEDFNIQLDDVAPGGNDGVSGVKMSMNVWGATDLPGPGQDHHLQVAFNGRQVTSGKFDGLQAKTLEAPLESVINGTNRVRLTLPMDTGFAFDAVNVNEIEVTYPRSFVATDNRLNFASRQSKFRVRGIAPNTTKPNGLPAVNVVAMREDADGIVEITNVNANNCRTTCNVELGGIGQLANYYVASTDGLHEPSLAPLPANENITRGNAKYLIISHPDFIGSTGNGLLEDLATELQSEMGSVDIVDVESIYAQFGNHIFDPEAIRDYIKFSHANRGTKYVLLVGGDVYDYKQFENENARSFIPSIYAATGNNVTFAPVDSKYADINDDNTPDLAIGRLPVRTTTQLQSLLSKRSAYLNRSYTGTALLVADTYDASQQYDFANDADQVQDDYLQGFVVDTAYADELGVSQARQKVREAINEGTTLTAFFGHSSTNQWSFNGLFTGPDAANLNNVGKPTIVTQWGCWNAYHVSPNEDSMGHRFLMEGDRGAVAVMGASTLTNADSERRLARKVFARLANGQRLGDAIVHAKLAYARDNPEDLDVLLGWTLLGFPELPVD